MTDFLLAVFFLAFSVVCGWLNLHATGAPVKMVTFLLMWAGLAASVLAALGVIR